MFTFSRQCPGIKIFSWMVETWFMIQRTKRCPVTKLLPGWRDMKTNKTVGIFLDVRTHVTIRKISIRIGGILIN
ncbi:hypothetical protein TSAR_015828 [Trichomalopsis sarcophagae]|uniref:Uncharacterized protein n=1 Tax=Trichomalopsis sarcophagae TaxID=543379 RepID=A0A232EEJ2_9HYME|nr:hypothetical protein TSAR_015828 [Trichomalopsis sarcophagae]